MKTVDILCVEDNPGDVLLMMETLRTCEIPCEMHVVEDGDQAINYLCRNDQYAGASPPDLILLDLNLPKVHGLDVINFIKQHPDLKKIPVIVVTASAARSDILASYSKYANCFVTKPIGLEQFDRMVRGVAEFWLSSIVKLPSEKHEQE